MGIQTPDWRSSTRQGEEGALRHVLTSPVAYVTLGLVAIISLFVFEYAFAKGTAERAVEREIRQGLISTPERIVPAGSEVKVEPVKVNLPSRASASSAASQRATTNSRSIAAPMTIVGQISQSDVDELADRVEVLKAEKIQLENNWRIERNKLDSAKARLEDSQRTIRLEMDEVLLNNSPRERLDELLSQHEALISDSKKIAKNVSELEEQLAGQQLLLVQAGRDLERMQSNLAAQKREQDIQRVQEISRHLDRDLRFAEVITFKCAPNKSLEACLNEYPLESRIQGWVQDQYQASLAEELAGQFNQIRLSPDWYSSDISRKFTEANMKLDGTVSAEIEVKASIVSRKMMACALLGAPADLCENKSVSLIVRSNKYGDQVLINNKSYGSTPLSVILDPGVYNIEVKYQGLTQKRTLTLEENRNLHFVF